MNEPIISICIPAYKKPQYVARALESIIRQDYKNVEIIISDDSPGEDTKAAIEPFRNSLTIKYFHNQPALRSPKNWNNALNKSSGDYVVLMHQDDWYHTDNALTTFVNVFKETNADFVFSQNTAVTENGETKVLQALPSLIKRLHKIPNQLVLAQVIGPPSNTMLRRNIEVRYDERFIWFVDVDYYVRLLKKGYRYSYIEKHLVSIGIHEDQTTAFCRANNDIIFKENIWFANKMEQEAFNDIKIFDYYWRLLRNYQVRKLADIVKNGVAAEQVPGVILHMLQFQKKITQSILRKGAFSKSLMVINYIKWRMKYNTQATGSA